MRQYRLWVVVLVMAVFALPASFAEGTLTKDQKIHKLMELTGSSQLGIQAMNQMLDAITAGNPNVPPTFAEEFKKSFNPDSLTAMIAPIWSKYFTDKEIDDLITFYGTETGKKIISVMPVMMHEMQQTGQEWGMRVGKQVQEKLKGQTGGK